MTSEQYWKKREDEALKHYIKDEKEYDKRIAAIYADMLDAIENDINDFYTRYARTEGISLAEAKKRVTKLDMEKYERKAARYVKDATADRAKNKGKTNFAGYYFSKQANDEMRLYNATMRINRLEMLKANIGLELVKGHAQLESFMGEILQGRALEESKRLAGILGKSVINNAQKAHALVNASFHNATFADRLWAQQGAMKADLAKLLQTGMIQGKNSRELAKDLRKYYKGPDRLKNGKSGVKFNTERLMRTELARVQIEVQRMAYEEEHITHFKFVTNSGCCDVCAHIEAGGPYLVSEMMPGKNAPPMHPFCRCSTAPYMDRERFNKWLEYVSNGGTVTWSEWKGD